MKTRNANPKHSTLEANRPLFFLVGLSLSLLTVYAAFEMNFAQAGIPDFSDDSVFTEEIDWTIPVTVMRTPEPPSKPKSIPKFNPNEFTVIDNNATLPNLTTEWNTTTIDEGLEVIVDPDPVEVFTFTQVESMPVFAGCEEALTNDERYACMNSQLMAYVSSNFEVTDRMIQFSRGEKLFVEFIIEKNGLVRNATIVRGEDELIAEEALRVVKSLPRFTPAKMNGKPVRMSYILPINVKF
ncbi:MAG: energy transducer TonB [Flavobacteriales bacterium]|nr:energy transducer TonB [Cryomorphaceae bacterium]|tara:strand:+ start:2333 stop:3052 length:720 start_codon:yes stop_codon:yes gene_type:complete